MEIGDVGGVKKLLARACERVSARSRVKRHDGTVKEILHVNNELLKLFDLQSLHGEVGLAREEVLIIGGEGC